METASDRNTMFREGFLADIYNEKPLGANGINKIVTRFPPEPNGYLHLGHSKAIAINFGFAKYHGGECYLRFDDTNPAAEEERYFTAIKDVIRWLGFTPAKVTYSSDNFDRLYELAEKLIMLDGAYVCHCSATDLKIQRGFIPSTSRFGGPRHACPHRNRPPTESLTEFRAMRGGKYTSNSAFLRLKQDLTNPNPQMWDLAAYRILDEALAHFRTGSAWRIYPTYDFTHCLCDSFEGVTHSLCTSEFELSRESYEWLCEKVEVYKPTQREYGRLNISGTVLSKRKILELITKGYVRDWDDPRLFTLIALRRRGVPPEAILAFVNGLGVTKAPTTIEAHKFDQVVRQYLETSVPRLMLVLEPVKVVIENLLDGYEEFVEVPFSKEPAFGSHTIPFTKIIYIDRNDFNETPSKNFFRLVPRKPVGLLKVPYPITCTSYEKDPKTGLVTLIRANYDKPNDGTPFKKPKSYIHWIPHSPSTKSPINVKVRAFNPLFTSSNPTAHPDGYLSAINPNSEIVYPNALIETGFEEIRARAPWPVESGTSEKPHGPESVRFQGMRSGYYCVDAGSEGGEVVLNRIVSLKEDRGKF